MAGLQFRHRVGGRAQVSIVAVMMLSGAASVGLWGWTHHRVETHIYSGTGFGGFVGANRKPIVDTPLQRASDAYAASRYAEAEQTANDLVRQASGLHPDPRASHEALLARRILAYSSARQNRFAEAKTRFAALRQAAYLSPDHGKQRIAVGDVAPTLEEEAAFQQAVCTSALGDKRAAEAEYDAFLRSYPQSILVHGAVKRIARLHGGDVPKDAEALWKQAMSVQKAADEAQRKANALCGPECLAELLKRREAGRVSLGGAEARRETPENATPDVQTLAAEMHTGAEGSTVAAIQATAAKHGLKLQGVSMTLRGLAKQKLPLIALITPGHYVLVEAVTLSSVTVWDPDAGGVGVSGRQIFSADRWEKVWSGAALR